MYIQTSHPVVGCKQIALLLETMQPVESSARKKSE